MRGRAILTVVGLLSLCSCSDRSSLAAPYRSPFDRLVVSLGLEGTLGYIPCFPKEEPRLGGARSFVGSEECFRFNRPERMHGVWLVEFEGSEFLPNVSEPPAQLGYSEDTIWLEFGQHASMPPDWRGDRAFAIDFIGRRASYPGFYGHMGNARHLIVVDKLVSAKRVAPPRKINLPAHPSNPQL